MKGLDDHITGHGGEDQFPSVEPPELTDTEWSLVYAAVVAVEVEIGKIAAPAALPYRAIASRVRSYLTKIG